LQAQGPASSQYMISDVALAIMRMHAISPSNMWHSSRLIDQDSRILSPVADFNGREQIVLNEMRLVGVIRLDRAIYIDGTLVIDQAFPESVLISLEGRPFSEIADHPAFAFSGAIVSSVEASAGPIRLFHEPVYYSLDDACRIAEAAWLSA